MKFQNQWTKTPTFKPEVNKLPSMTIPDQTSTIDEIMKRYVTTGDISGLSSPRTGAETGDIETDDLTMMDKVEREELIKRNQQRITEMQDKLKQQASAKKKKQQADDKQQQQQQQQQQQPQPQQQQQQSPPPPTT